jgi:glycosyltransferase involved in cell wall biosynthesis
MTNSKRVLVIVPAWNEAESVGDVVREIHGELPEADVLVVDDGSTDDTARLAREAGAAVAKLPFNLGVGGVMRLGYRYARGEGYDVAVQIDADGQHDPRYVPKLIDGLQDASLVIGARFAGEGDYRVRGPRRWAMALLSMVLSAMAGSRLTDTTSGFRACDRAVIELFADWYPVEYLGDTVETLVRVIRLGYRVHQVPVAMRRRFAGMPSHSPVRALVYLCRAFLTLLLALIRR